MLFDWCVSPSATAFLPCSKTPRRPSIRLALADRAVECFGLRTGNAAARWTRGSRRVRKTTRGPVLGAVQIVERAWYRLSHIAVLSRVTCSICPLRPSMCNCPMWLKAGHSPLAPNVHKTPVTLPCAVARHIISVFPMMICPVWSTSDGTVSFLPQLAGDVGPPICLHARSIPNSNPGHSFSSYKSFFNQSEAFRPAFCRGLGGMHAGRLCHSHYDYGDLSAGKTSRIAAGRDRVGSAARSDRVE
jgi:hypothetical protein